MAAKVRIPAPLRKLTKEQPVVSCEGKNIDEIPADLEQNYPGMKERICDEDGQTRRFMALQGREGVECVPNPRGIGRDEARRMLVRAFVNDIVARVRIDGLREELEAVLDREGR